MITMVVYHRIIGNFLRDQLRVSLGGGRGGQEVVCDLNMRNLYQKYDYCDNVYECNG